MPIKKFPDAGLWYCVISPDIPLQPYGVNISVFISRNNPRQLSLKRRTQRLMGMACGGGFQSRGFRIRELQTINWNPTFTLLLYRSEMPSKTITLLKWNVKEVWCIKIIYYRVCNSMYAFLDLHFATRVIKTLGFKNSSRSYKSNHYIIV